ncbi:MAG: 3-hydroxyacyl-CoA dehydrogenase NAD-binding domain-containing protein [Porticoccaceae bacterium]|nr:3-hydroxyacyl-CoA dehydrogenase NAD-binding domain-containing protein [Porticoccaceae bacterium]
MTVDVMAALRSDRLELGSFTTLNTQPDSAPKDSVFKHWHLSANEDGIRWLLFDRQDTRVNSIDQDVLDELNVVLAELEKSPPQALVIRSAKKNGFCAGADIAMFKDMTDPAAVRAKLQQAHDIVDRLERLKTLKICLIHGVCLGGGLELALACDLRIAIKGAKLGFPEVLLGLHPGLGGTFRTTRLINPLEAMTLMLSGKTLQLSKAKALGLVDAVTEERHLANAVTAAAAGQLKKQRRPAYFSVADMVWPRGLIANRMAAETGKKVSRQHYPAPFRLIDLWRQHGGDRVAMQNAEIASFAELVVTPTAQNLVRVFYLREQLKQQQAVINSDIHHVHVVGAGTMGGDIAAWCALNGLRVTLGDQQLEMIAKAIKRATGLYKRKHLTPGQIRDALDRLIPDPKGLGIARADLVIEAVPEKIDIKRAVYNQLQGAMKDGAILATNTSSIPIETLMNAAAFPTELKKRFVGLHFFNPVAQMQLVELVSHDEISEQARGRATAFIKQIDRLPVPVASAPGFLVNRVLTPYLLEAMLLLDEGIDAETIDQCAVNFGMPMGPIELADQVGLDICIAVGDTLREQLTSPVAEVPLWIREKVTQGETGRKAGKGFYTWNADGAEKKNAPSTAADITDRLILPMLNACVSCLRENIVSDENVLDGAVIFGTGFAPFRGGPIHYAKTRGIADIVAALKILENRYGERFSADDGWQSIG